jgi:hypothetical protein
LSTDGFRPAIGYRLVPTVALPVLPVMGVDAGFFSRVVPLGTANRPNYTTAPMIMYPRRRDLQFL